MTNVVDFLNNDRGIPQKPREDFPTVAIPETPVNIQLYTFMYICAYSSSQPVSIVYCLCIYDVFALHNTRSIKLFIYTTTIILDLYLKELRNKFLIIKSIIVSNYIRSGINKKR